MLFIKLSKESGDPLLINPDDISRFESTKDGLYVLYKSVNKDGNFSDKLKETPKDVVAILKFNGLYKEYAT